MPAGTVDPGSPNRMAAPTSRSPAVPTRARRLERAEGFLGRAAAALGSTSAAGALSGILRELGTILGAQAWLLEWDPDLGRASWAGGPEAGPIPLRMASSREGLLGDCLRRGQDCLQVDPRGDAGFPEKSHLARRGGLWDFVALTAGEDRVGCLILRWERGGPSRAQRAALVDGIEPLLALHLRCSQLRRDLEARVEKRTVEISLLFDISRSLGFVLTPDDLFQLLGSALSRALPFDLCAFTLLRPDTPAIRLQLTGPAEEAVVRRFTRSCLAELERLTGRPAGKIPVSVARGRGGHEAAPLKPSQLRSVAHVPLHVRGDTVGMVSVGSREADAFGESSMRLVYTIANQASLTLDRIQTAGRAETSRLHSMLESMTEGVLLLDRDLRIVLSNPASRAHLGALFRGRAPRALARLGEVRLKGLLEPAAGEAAAGRTFEVAAPSDHRIFSVTCSPVRGLEEMPEGMVVVLSDVTEARARELQLAQSEKLSALGEMISGIAHELNNPLATVMAQAQHLMETGVDPGLRRKLATIDQEATRCRNIVQVLLQFSRPHAPERRPVDVNVALDSVLQLLGHQLQVDDITVQADLQPSLPPVVGDLHLLQQVFFNIVHNAHQAMSEKGGPHRLTVRSRSAGGRVIVELSDTGPGIPPRHLKRIFNPFFSTKDVGKGTGLGLSLAEVTVRDHGGAIRARSRPGRGATFSVELPAAPGAALPAEAAGRPGRAAPSAAPDPSPGRGGPKGAARGRRILVVEDEAPLAEVLAEVLGAHGFIVETAADGRLAWERVRKGGYDLIISDLKMPQMNGRDLYRHVAASDPAMARRIVFSTGDAANPETQAFFEKVGNPYLTKPFNISELLRVVEKVLAAG